MSAEEDKMMEEAYEAYIEQLKDYLTPILIEYNEYIESSCFEENKRSEDWMIKENVSHFLDSYLKKQDI
jgi:hypothetical protein